MSLPLLLDATRLTAKTTNQLHALLRPHLHEYVTAPPLVPLSLSDLEYIRAHPEHSAAQLSLHLNVDARHIKELLTLYQLAGLQIDADPEDFQSDESTSEF
eukprot:TRINITY_DN6136_c0_g1_i1.p1 TRINITY_DN6136_c0_g1~~TRINITY_DN6136_c0_g1_i1.p1  ORF type:complete len:101 (-),score=14.11 TRINITY_DN6136_c0_g1_i1:66-368(-)